MSKPEWARRTEYHKRMIEIAERGLKAAAALRCPERESGGAQCTADAKPDHRHRCHEADLPGTPVPQCGAVSATGVMKCGLTAGHDTRFHTGVAANGTRRNWR